MQKIVRALLEKHGITLCAPLALRHCRVQRPYLLERVGITDGTAFLFAVPYYTTHCDHPARNISAYAVSRDYHLYFRSLFDEILPQLQAAFPQNRFAGFTDHAPIAEVDAAVRAGLGVRGCNGMLLTERYGSYVFLGEIVTDACLEATPAEPKGCADCGACLNACPVALRAADCLSALTQKKQPLDEKELIALRAHGCAWGCDRCQAACPVNLAAKKRGSIYTEIPFFAEDALPSLTADAVEAMSEEAFAARAYSWRGKQVILRNLRELEKGDAQ